MSKWPEVCCWNCKLWSFVTYVYGSNIPVGTCDVEVEVPDIYYRAKYVAANRGVNCPFFAPRAEERKYIFLPWERIAGVEEDKDER